MHLPWQESLWHQFEQSVERRRLAHAFLLEGPAGLGKSQFALRMAARMLGFDQGDLDAGSTHLHPDLIQPLLGEQRDVGQQDCGQRDCGQRDGGQPDRAAGLSVRRARGQPGKGGRLY